MNTQEFSANTKGKKGNDPLSPGKTNWVVARKAALFLNKRSLPRIKGGALSALFDSPKILVQIVKDKETIDAYLLDICEGGLAVNLPKLLAVDSPIEVSFRLGQKKIASKAVIRQVVRLGKNMEECVTGIMFVDLAKEPTEYIRAIVHLTDLLISMEVDVDGAPPTFVQSSVKRNSPVL